MLQILVVVDEVDAQSSTSCHLHPVDAPKTMPPQGREGGGDTKNATTSLGVCRICRKGKIVVSEIGNLLYFAKVCFLSGLSSGHS
jgi:hypothetical protein